VVSISPTDPITDEGLTVTLDTPSVDPDGDAITYNYEWRKDGVTYTPSGSADQVASGVIFRYEDWSVTVTASDAALTGASGTDTVTVSNAPPTIVSCDVTPASPGVADDLTASASGITDAEGDTVTISYYWLIDYADGNGFINIGVLTSTLSYLLTEQGYTIKAVCAPDDGIDTGDEVESAVISLGNSPPSITSCDIGPAAPTSVDDLTASYSGYYDPNGDPETVFYTWYLNGVEDTSVTDATYPSANTARTDKVMVSCEPYDGEDYGAPVDSIEVEILNAPPTAPVVHIEPPGATSSDNLLATIDVVSVDPEGDAITYEYEWVIAASTVGTGDNLGYSYTARDDVVVLTVVGCDTFGDCTVIGGSDNITIGNSPPELANCTITPTYPYTGADLTATPNGEYDEDGDTVTYTYIWYVDEGSGYYDVGVYTQVLPGTNVFENTQWQVECTPVDSLGAPGTPVISQPVFIGNAPPSLTDCTVTPSSPVTTDDLTAIPGGGTDPDGDPVTYEFKWYLNGIVDTAQTANVYPYASTQKNDIITADCIPTDGMSTGQALQAASVTVQNSAPGQAVVDIAPAAPTTVDNLTASILTDAVDADGDLITYSYAWNETTTPASATGSTVSYTLTERGHIWEVLVTACDSDLTNPLCGSDASATVNIDNSLPTLSSCDVSPPTAYTTDDLLASPANWNDADADPEQVLYEWFIDSGSGFVSSGVLTDTLSNSLTSKGLVVQVECTPYDVHGSGTTVTSSPLTIENSPPTLASCELFSVVPDSDDDVVIQIGTWSDPDPGDSASNRYEWYNNGVLDVAETGLTYPASSTLRGDVVYAKCFPGDGTTEGTSLQTSNGVVANSAPSVPTVVISPTSPTTSDQLDASFTTPSVDPDGDGVLYSYTWTINSVVGTAYTSGSIPSTETAKDEIWEVSVTACDDYAPDPKCTTIPATASETIVNTAPSLTSVTLSPTSPTSLQDVTASPIGAYDADFDAISFSIKWYHDQDDGAGFVEDPTEVTSIFPYVKTQKQDMLKAEYTPIDVPDGLAGASVQSSYVLVVNSPPSMPYVYITPTNPGELEDLLCNFSGSSDADTDPVTYSIAWFEQTLGQSTTTSTTLSSSETSLGHRWHCEVTPNDGEVDGTTGVSSYVDIVDNTAPDAPVIDPIDSHRNDTVLDLSGTCVAGCDIVTIYCADSTYSWQETTPCSGTGDFDHTLANPMNPGYPTTCSATCTDTSSNESGASNQVTTESCLIIDIYENALGDGDSAANAIDFATMPDTNSVEVIEANILQENLVWDTDWYRFDTTDDSVTDTTNGFNAFDFKVELTQGTGTYSFLVYRGGYDPATDMQCPASVNSGYTDYNFFAQDVADGSHNAPAITNECGGAVGATDPAHNFCEDLGSVFYIEVLRDGTAASSCDYYELLITNGAP
jgi:hypothetical protein